MATVDKNKKKEIHDKLVKAVEPGQPADNVVIVLFRNAQGLAYYPQDPQGKEVFEKLWRILA